MRKLWYVLPAIALALTGLLFMACPVDDNGGGDVNTSGLEAAIKDANNAKYGVKEATTAGEVATGVSWVTATDMKSLNDAIEEAEAAKDNASTQAVVDAAKAKLEGALAAFNTAKQPGNAAAITLSGTITVKNNGQTVPYVIVYPHTENWNWQEEIRLSSSEANTPWSITTKAFSVETEIFFRVQGYQNEFEGDDPLFNIDVKNFKVSVKDTNKSDIFIDLADLSLFTLSGTINVSYDGKPIPSMDIQVLRKSDYFLLGESPSLLSAGNNTPWSIAIEALNEETDVVLSIVGSNSDAPWSEEDRLFALWSQDFGVKVKDQNKSGIAINFISISGTINVTYDGELVPYVYLVINNDETRTWLGDTVLEKPIANAKWSVVLPAFDTAQNNLSFWVTGGRESGGDWDLFFIKEIKTNHTIKDQNLSGIILDLGNIEDD